VKQKQTIMIMRTYTYTEIFVAIETLLRVSGHYCHHLVSVVDEANKYCYKTFDGKIGVVDKSFIHSRIRK
jgi:hypothetical protein